MLYAVNQFFSMLSMLVYGPLQGKLGTRRHLIWLVGIVIALSGPFLTHVCESLLTSNFKFSMALGVIFSSLGYLAGCGLVESFVEKVSRRFNFEFSTVRPWGSFGYAAGTFIDGILFSVSPHINSWCVLVMGVLPLLTSMLLKINPPAPLSVRARSPEPNVLIRDDSLIIFKDTQSWSFVIFVVGTWSFYSICDQQIFPVFYASLFDDPELAPRVYDYLNSAQVFMETAGMALVPFLINHIGPRSALLLGGTIMACRILDSILFTDIYIISLIRTLCAPEAPLFVTSAFRFSVANFDRRLSSTVYLISFSITSPIGIIVLSLSIGKSFDKVGYQGIPLIMANIVVITLILSYFSLSRKHHQQEMRNGLVTEQ